MEWFLLPSHNWPNECHEGTQQGATYRHPLMSRAELELFH